MSNPGTILEYTLNYHYMYKNLRTVFELKKCNHEDGLAMLEVLNIFSGKWKMLILCLLFEGEIRFTEIQKLIPAITPRMLSKELKDLELNGIVKRTATDSGITVRYGLTMSAMGLRDKIIGLLEWGVMHRKDALNKKF